MVSVLSLRKSTTSGPLDTIQTDQLKGLAILFVILGHLWVHVSQTKPVLVMSGEAVALFLMLSGFGLTRSLGKRLTLKEFVARRLRRVLIPYWLSTIGILILDYLLLHRVYGLPDLISTFMGINVTVTTHHIDYVRWYITLLLIWYVLFFLASYELNHILPEAFLFLCAGLIFIMDYYVVHVGFYQVFAFPTGCFLGRHLKRFQTLFIAKPRSFIYLGVSLLAFYVTYTAVLCRYIKPHMPFIIYRAMGEFSSILFSLSLIILVAGYGSRKYASVVLGFTGALSYELFLLHGSFLIKYNPIFGFFGSSFIWGAFLVFLLFIYLLSIVFRETVSFCNEYL
jgi:peptidoglycan/LPS O-acetylase OafA/YrhL